MHIDAKRSGMRALAVLAVAGLIAIGAPAYAAAAEDEGADLKVTVSADAVTLDETFKDHATTVLNQGPAETAAGWDLVYDLSGLDDSVVTVGPEFHLGCALTDDKLACVDQPGLSKGNSFLQLAPFTLAAVPGKTGSAGSFTVTAVSENDPDPANNTATVAVEVPAKGVDLVAVAEDVFVVAADGSLTDDPVPPGGSSFVVGAVGNLGDTTASGLKVSVALPAHVTFAEVEPGCVYGADKRTVTCDYDKVTLVPVDQDTDKDDDIISVIGLFFPVKVSASAPGPVVLNGGKLSGYALATAEAATLARSESQALPQGLQALTPEAVKDADPADNTAAFKVHVGAPANTGGSGGNGGLPVTGPQAGLIGGIGAASVLLGAALVLVTRRRQVAPKA